MLHYLSVVVNLLTADTNSSVTAICSDLNIMIILCIRSPRQQLDLIVLLIGCITELGYVLSKLINININGETRFIWKKG